MSYTPGDLSALLGASTDDVYYPAPNSLASILSSSRSPISSQNSTQIRATSARSLTAEAAVAESAAVWEEKTSLNLKDHEDEQLVKQRRRQKYTKEEELDRAKRTLFVGNIVTTTTEKHIRRMFNNVESVRFRSISFEDPKVPPKAAFIRKQFHQMRPTMNAYVVLKKTATLQDDIKKALELNGNVREGYILRVDMAEHKNFDSERSVFVGNVPITAIEEELREHFSMCGVIENVRIIRDPKLKISKGIAYINFADKSAVTIALGLDGSKLKDRELRISKALNAEQLEKRHDRSNRPQTLHQQARKPLVGAARRVASKASLDSSVLMDNPKSKVVKRVSLVHFSGRRTSRKDIKTKTRHDEQRKVRKRMRSSSQAHSMRLSKKPKNL